MWQLFTGSLLLSVIHASIPNHWLPIIAIGKAEKWTVRETLTATAIAGFAHILSTVIIGTIVGFIGWQLSSSYDGITHYVAPAILILLGVVYIGIDIMKSGHSHDHSHINQNVLQSRSKWAIILSLSLAMFLSPCAELEIYFFQAGTLGWAGIFIVSLVYMICTVTFMMILVYLGTLGVSRLNWSFLEHHNRLVTGGVLFILGIVAFFVEY